MNIKIKKTLFAFALCVCTPVFATSYTLSSQQALIGKVQYNTAQSGDTVITIAQRYNLGYNAIENANPHLQMNRGFVYGTPLQIPTQHVLPNQAREGVVINLPEMRMYYYPTGTNQVFTYPIGIGKIGKTIPITKAKITRKTTDPTWTPPEDIREFNLEQGIILPKVMQPGPDNPLGHYAIYISIPTYLIHSTIFPESVGRRASFGCIRMYESDIEGFFPTVQGGIPVLIINAPTKAGWQDDRLFVETHPPLEEHQTAQNASLAGMVQLVSEVAGNQPVLIDWQGISYIAKEKDGIPHDVGIRIR